MNNTVTETKPEKKPHYPMCITAWHHKHRLFIQGCIQIYKVSICASWYAWAFNCRNITHSPPVLLPPSASYVCTAGSYPAQTSA